MNKLTQQILVEARGHLGVHEVGGNNRGPEVEAWLARVHCPPGSPWCAAFGWSMLDDACRELGLTNPFPPTASVHRFMERAKSMGAWTYTPEPGFIGFIDHGLDHAGNPIGHLTIIEDISGDVATDISGNTNAAGSREGNCVARHTKPVASYTWGCLDPGKLFSDALTPVPVTPEPTVAPADGPDIFSTIFQLWRFRSGIATGT